MSFVSKNKQTIARIFFILPKKMSKKSKKSGEKPSKIKKVEVTDESEPEPEDYDPTASWDCTVCTFKNRFEAFKCEICDTRFYILLLLILDLLIFLL